MKDIIDFAIDFAKKIQETKEYKDLQQAKKNNDNDENLTKKIVEYNILRNDVENIIREEKYDEKDIDNKNVEIKKKYDEIMSNENMKNFNEKSDILNNLMNRIHSILVGAVNVKEIDRCYADEKYDCGSCGK